MAHLVTIAVVALQAWLDRYCPLTVIDSALRQRAGQAGYEAGFVQHWVERLIYHHAPLWVFALRYTAFGLLVVRAWWRYPPEWRPPAKRCPPPLSITRRCPPRRHKFP